MNRFLLVLVLLSVPFISEANDGYAGYKAGKVELNFSSNTNVMMKSEVLTISDNDISVDYTFYNDSKKAENVLIAFPFPSVDCADFRYNLNNNFTAKVNGKAEMVSEEIRVLNNKGKDITKEVKALNLDLCRDQGFESLVSDHVRINVKDPENYKFKKGLDTGIEYFSNDKEILEKYLKAHALGYIAEYSGESLEFPWGPSWKVAKKSFFTVTFPAKKEIKISHSYTPWPSYQNSKPEKIGDKSFDKVEKLPVWYKGKEYLVKNPMRYELIPDGGVSIIEYILKTANTWKGPIQKFKLVLKRELNLAFSNYVQDYKEQGLDLVWETENFTPKEDLVVYYVDQKLAEKTFTGLVTPEEKKEFDSLSAEYDIVAKKPKDARRLLGEKFKAYIGKYKTSKNLPQAFSMLDYLESDM